LVRPYMELRIRQVGAEYTEVGTWRGASRYAREVDQRLVAILENRTGSGYEAQAYLLNLFNRYRKA
jgi:hypothetical protein